MAWPRTAGDEGEAALLQALSQGSRILEHLLLVRLELGAVRLFQRARQTSNGVVVGATLHSWHRNILLKPAHMSCLLIISGQIIMTCSICPVAHIAVPAFVHDTAHSSKHPTISTGMSSRITYEGAQKIAEILAMRIQESQSEMGGNPTCSPGKTEKLILSSISYSVSLPFLSTLRTPLRKKIMAPRGPRSDLWVVVVTTSAYSNGDGTTPACNNTSV